MITNLPSNVHLYYKVTDDHEKQNISIIHTGSKIKTHGLYDKILWKCRSKYNLHLLSVLILIDHTRYIKQSYNYSLEDHYHMNNAEK